MNVDDLGVRDGRNVFDCRPIFDLAPKKIPSKLVFSFLTKLKSKKIFTIFVRQTLFIKIILFAYFKILYI